MNSRRVTVPVRIKIKPFHGSPDLTAFVNVLFLLLIFAMLSSSFVKVSGIKVDLPAVDSQRSLSVERVVVTVDQNSQIFFKISQITFDGLKQKLGDLSSSSENPTVILRADAKTPFGTVAKILSLAEEARVNVFIATAPPPPDTKNESGNNYDER